MELASATRAAVNQELAVVGNLVGDQTVSVVPKAAGRLESITVKLGDRVTRGQRIAKIEDQELLEQVKQAEAAFQVASATIRQREADLELAKTNAERSRNLFQRQLLPQQTLDDSEAKYQSAQAALDLARAQNTQSQARLDELRATLQNTIITSPVNGFVARRGADAGAYVSANAPIVDLVDITTGGSGERHEKDLAARPRKFGSRRSRCVSGRELRGSHRTDCAGARSGDAHRLNRNRDSERPVPAETGHVCARRYRDRLAPERNRGPDQFRGRRQRDTRRSLAVTTSRSFVRLRRKLKATRGRRFLDGVSDGDRVVTTGAGTAEWRSDRAAGRGGPDRRTRRAGPAASRQIKARKLRAGRAAPSARAASARGVARVRARAPAGAVPPRAVARVVKATARDAAVV